MPKRLRMTLADYVAIAISPALVMLLVGSLVYFLIEVFYAGEYQARLNYVFALFVFAAVLIARIAIEMGSERAVLFALPLGIATFLVLLKFVEHPSPFSHAINLALIGVIWWCAHKLTWDSTLIDDDEDASGQGLLQHLGVDEADAEHSTPGARNELSPEIESQRSSGPRWWSRLSSTKKGPHTPGLWVLYFSLAALPLFGIGQHWIPAGQVGRRRYAFGLLAVYVFSALALLVTTSFLGLRRYLRQRHVEMPAPMAANWVTVGAVLIGLVMLMAALLPRPAAEVAISQIPWQASSPGGLSASRYGMGNDGAINPDQPGDVVSQDPNAPQGDAVDPSQQSDAVSGGGDEQTATDQRPGEASSGSSDATSSDSRARSGNRDGQGGAAENAQTDRPAESSSSSSDSTSRNAAQAPTDAGQQSDGESKQSASELQQAESSENEQQSNSDGRITAPLLEHKNTFDPRELPEQIASALGGLSSLLKLLFYAAVALLLVYFFWKNRHAIARALADILRDLRNFLARLFGARSSISSDNAGKEKGPSKPRRRTLAEFRNPFASGAHQGMSPEEIVRYTFEAFEAWAADHGTPRDADQTPHELVRAAVAPQTELHAEARRLTRLYSESAYAARRISREEAEALENIWRLMQSTRLEPATTELS